MCLYKMYEVQSLCDKQNNTYIKSYIIKDNKVNKKP